MLAWAKEYGRKIDDDEAGVVILTHVDNDRGKAEEITRRFFAGFPAPPEALAARSAVGTAEQCAAKVRQYVEAGCTKFVLWPVAPPENLVEQVERVGTEIAPAFPEASPG